jgi:multidrug efflux pump subunit AcrA (membrane-fusion protein)
MKRNQFCVWSLLLAALALAGCKKNPGEAAVGEATVEIGPKYSAKSGLSVPSDTRLSLGLKIVEVMEQKVPATLDVQLRVYQASKESILASASVTPEETKTLKPGLVVHARSNDANLAGRILRVDDELLKATGMAEVLVELNVTTNAPALGGFFSASVALESEATVVTVPRAALLECSDGNSVYTVSGDNFVRAPVKVGAMSGDLVEIKDGLYAGDQVVLQPVMSLWMTELAATKGGQACCAVPAKGK